ncbi:MAG: cytochrome P450 [Microthrixaceae bacterium]|nr:cytochrome P450 [Microthrixaceae bacterium]
MRAHEPVYRDEANGLWAVTRHADVLDVERRSDVFLSGPAYRALPSPDETNMIAQDDPRHGQQRRLVSREFTPAAVRTRADEIRSLVVELLDEALEAAPGGRGELEVVDRLAAQLPARLTCRLLGFPEAQWRDLKSWSERLMRLDTMDRDPEVALGVVTACFEFNSQLDDLLAERAGCPMGDLLSTWANAEIDGEPLDRMSVFHETGLFISGGSETTRTVIAHGLRAFCDHPDQWERLAEAPQAVPAAVEELLRWVTPLNNFFRTAAVDTEVGGQAVGAGERVILLYPSANRDEAVFDDPFRFDIARTPNHHVAFGYGTHFCLGANLARQTLRLLLEELPRRITDLEVVTEPDVEPNLFARAVRRFDLGYRRR